MGQLSVDVYDALGNRMGQPIRTSKTVTIKRRLDGAGTISLSYVGTDLRAVEHLQRERRVRIRYDDGISIRQLGSGIIRKDDYSDASGQTTLTFSGPDALDELKRRNVLTNLIYDGISLNTLVDELLAMSVGWASNVTLVNPITARFDAASLLKAIQGAADAIGLHLRLANNVSAADEQAGIYNRLDLGAFGEASGLVALNPAQMTPAMNNNHDIAIIDSIAITGDTSAVATRIYVLGAGQNLDTSLTLEKSTRSIINADLYDIGIETRNGRDHYYIENLTATAEFGLIEKFVRFREIAPLSASENDEVAAANALYDRAAPELVRMSQAQIVYRLSLRKVKQTLLPGETIRLRYEDPIKRIHGLTGVQAPREINQDFFILAVTERFGEGNHTVSLDISNVDAQPNTLAQKVFNSIQDMKVYADQIQPSIVPYPYSETVMLDADGDANAQQALIGFPIQNFAYRIDRVVMSISTDVFEATSKGAAGGGGAATIILPPHKHIIFKDLVSASISPANRGGSMATGDGSLQSAAFWSTAPIGSDLWTLDAGGSGTTQLPNHTHPQDYGVYRDTTFPGALTITVNGTSITPTPIATTESAHQASFDITELIVNKVGGFQAVHEIQINCAEGRGRVKVNLDASIYMLPFRYKQS